MIKNAAKALVSIVATAAGILAIRAYLKEDPIVITGVDVPPAVILIAIFVFGVIAGWFFRSFYASHRIGTTAVLDDERRNKIEQVVLQMEPWLKALMKTVYQEKEAFARTDDWAGLLRYSNRWYEQFFVWEKQERSRVCLRGTKLLDYCVETFPDAFSPSEELLRNHAVYDPSKTQSYNLRSSDIDCLDWWWYSHNESDDYQAQFREETDNRTWH